MTQYKLLKDLPTFKAGEKFHINQNGSLVADESGVVAYACSTLDKFPNILEDWFEKISEDGPWRPIYGEEVWYIYSYGYIDSLPWSSMENDLKALEIGNYFKTREEAERAVKWLKARKVLMDDTKGFRPKKGEFNVYVYYNFYADDGEHLRFNIDRTNIDSPIVFGSKEDAKTSIQKHRAEWLTYFGIEEEDV